MKYRIVLGAKPIPLEPGSVSDWFGAIIWMLLTEIEQTLI